MSPHPDLTPLPIDAVAALAALGAVALKTSLLLGATWLLVALRPAASAARRHLVWLAALGGAVALPLLAVALPELRVPILPAGWSPRVEAPMAPAASPVALGTAAVVARPAETIAPAAASVASTGELAASGVSAPAPATASAPAIVAVVAAAGQATIEDAASAAIAGVSPALPRVAPDAARPLALVALWITGVVLCLVPVVLGRFRVRALERAARPLDDPAWRALAERLARERGVRRPVRLLVGSESAMPMTWGWRRPVVLLPLGASGWSADRRRDVLVHELAHVARGDCATQLVAQLACALHWYNPLAWLAASRLRAERERACDDEVLKAGAPASRYAGHLLDVARGLRAAPGTGVAALAMARPSQLEGRLLAMLDARRSRAGVTAGLGAGIWSATLLLAGVLAAVRPARAGEAGDADRRADARAAAPVAPADVSVAPAQAARAAAPLVTDSAAAPLTAAAAASGASREAMAALGQLVSLSQGMLPPSARAADSLCLDGARGGSGNSVQIHQNTDERELTVRVQRGDCRLELEGSGEITYAADLSDITGIARGGWVDLSERTRGATRELELRPGANGAIERRWKVDGETRPYDEEARRWVADLLAALNQRTGFMAEAHAKHLLANGGVPALLAYVTKATGDHAQRVYLGLALAQPGLDAATLQRIVELAGSQIESDYELAQLLVDVARARPLTPEAAVAYVAAVRSIDSDYESRRALAALLASGATDRRVVPTLLEASAAIDSDYELAELLIDVSKRGLVDDGSRPAFFAALRGVGSDYERRRVLSGYAARGDYRPEDVGAMLGIVETVRSDYEKASFLVEVARQARLAAAWAEYVRALGTITSDYEQRRALSAVLARGDLTEAQVRGLLGVAGAGLDSDYELAEFLVAVAAKHRIEGETREAYLAAADKVGSDHEYGRVMSAVRGRETRARM